MNDRAVQVVDHQQQDGSDLRFCVASIVCKRGILGTHKQCVLERTIEALTHSGLSRTSRARYMAAAAT